MVMDGSSPRSFRNGHGVWRTISVAFAAAVCCAAPGTAQEAGSLDVDAAKAIIAPFYAALTSTSREDMERNLGQATVAEWQNCGTNDACESRSATLARWAARPSIVPDLRWELREILVSGDHVVVRGQDTGTPVAPMFGIAPKGHSFSIMTIDVHEVRDGKIVRSHHLEDWARATQQLSAP